DQSVPLRLGAGKVTSLLEAARRGQTLRGWRRRVHDGDLLSHRGQTFSSDAAAVAQDRPATPGGLAAEEAVLAFAADFRRLILSFHVSLTVSKSSSAPQAKNPQADKALRRSPALREARE